MKRYLTAIFISLSIVIIILGIVLDFYWSGIAAWGIVIILLILAVYCTKYISDDNKEVKK